MALRSMHVRPKNDVLQCEDDRRRQAWHWLFGRINTTRIIFKDPVRTAQQTLRLGYKTSQLMLYREIMAVCSEIHTKHINTVCGQNVELLNVKLAVHMVTTGL
jgi:hypothetical protein